tara:strand:+ start:437 stop:745 length:309 start_codon:yes stop_codon:yes gene_type:complete
MSENTVGLGSGPFSDTSPEAQDMLNTISDVIGGNQRSALPSGLENVAKAAGVEARGAKTLEDQQSIYKKHISNATDTQTKQSFTSGTIKEFERIANSYRTRK